MRFILLFFALVLVSAILLRSEFEHPILQWVGHLPGDLIVRKNGVAIYLPLTSSFCVSLVFSFLASALRRK